MIKELDYFEYANRAAARAAYPTDSGFSDTAIEVQDPGEDDFDYFGDLNGNEKRHASRIILTEPTLITGYAYHLGGASGVGDHTVRIVTDVDNKPSGVLADANLIKVITPVINSWNTAMFATPALIGPGTFWVWLDCDDQGTNVRWNLDQDTSPTISGLSGAGSTDGGSTWTAYENKCITQKLYKRQYDLQCDSEDTIKVQGSHSLKGIAVITAPLNDTLASTVNPTIDLTGLTSWKFWLRSSRTGANIKVGIHDAGGVTTEVTHTIIDADIWEEVVVDISGVADADKDAIDSRIITLVNADAPCVFYIDNMYAESVVTGHAVFFGSNF